MKIKDIVRLLVLNESQNDAEGLITLFRNNGYPTRAHRIVSEADLEQLLAGDPWDLLICDGKFPELSVEQALAIFRQDGHDIPAIQLLDDASTAAAAAVFDSGVQDVVATADTDHLIHAALREIGNRRERLDNRDLRRQLDEVRARYDLLMEGSRDAIAYVTGGMHIEVNDAYAQQFGYADTDELASMPLVDLIAAPDQDKFKAFLKEYGGDAGTRTLDITGERSDGSPVAMTLEFSPATYEGEECTQLIIRGSGGGQASGDGGDTRALHAVLDAVSATRRDHNDGALALIRPINIDAVRRGVGYLAANHALTQLADHLADVLAPASVFALADGDLLALFPARTAEAACKALAAACTELGAHLFDIDGRSAQFECRAGIVAINERSPDNAGQLVDQAHQGLVTLLEGTDRRPALVYVPPAGPIAPGTRLDLDQLSDEGRLTLLFQPIVSLRGDAGEYYEVIPMLTDTDGVRVDPVVLAPGQVNDNGESGWDRWVIFEATKRLARQRSSGTDTRLIINITPTALQDNDLPAWLGVATKAAGLPPESVALQLREVDATGFMKLAVDFFAAVRNLGCRAAIGDFATTGADAVRLLKQAAVDFVKIHPDLAQSACQQGDTQQSLKNLIGELNSDDTAAIVPQVDSAATLAALWQIGAGYIQGSYLAEPGAAMDYEFAEIA